MVPTDNPSVQGTSVPTPLQGGIPFRHPRIQVAHTAATASNISQETLAARRAVLPWKFGSLLPAEDRRFLAVPHSALVEEGQPSPDV